MILLDRDGVLNDLVGGGSEAIDSPLTPEEIRILPRVPEALARLTNTGYLLSIVSNQPAAAKGKISYSALQAIHNIVLDKIQSAGGRIQGSYICFHKAADYCQCRKPGIGLLEKAFNEHNNCGKSDSWIIGDSLKDIKAGKSFGVRTAYIPSRSPDPWNHTDVENKPDMVVNDLYEFTERIIGY